MSAFSLRPLEGDTPSNSNALEGSFRVYLSQTHLKQLGVTTGDYVRLKTSEDGFVGYGVAWLSPQTNAGTKPIAKVSNLLREKYQLKFENVVFIENAASSMKPLKAVEISTPESEAFASIEHFRYWAVHALADIDIILPKCKFMVQQKAPKSSMKTSRFRSTVLSVTPPDEKHAIYFDPVLTKVVLTREQDVKEPVQAALKTLQLDNTGIGGLSDQIRVINNRLKRLSAPFTTMNQYLSGPIAFLLHGSEGSGKSLLLDRLAECPWKAVYRVSPELMAKNQAKILEETFTDAQENQPSLILMDNLDDILEKAKSLVSKLRVEMRNLEGAGVVVAAAARSIYDIDASLRTPSAFKTELEIFAPNVKQREDILQHILGPPNKIFDVDFLGLAERSHGFVGRDLHKLCGLARDHRVEQIHALVEQDKTLTLAEACGQIESQAFVAQKDIDAVFDQVQPTVLKDSILEVPKVMWTEIAGLDHVRAELEAIMVRPFKNPECYAKLRAGRQRKGVLLYGPPGCAKTLIAQAVATESNQNFLAVKGSELVKMYVGESERAIRDVFRKARAAKPCIIFFDEIDSIGKSRERTHDSGLNVVTTLLNEMDGIEALRDVFIIAATNRPDILDSALIRPGRFDSHIHIGLPDEEARKQILQIHTRMLPLADDVDLSSIAQSTNGSSGADLSGLCAIAVEHARVDLDKFPEIEPHVRMSHFEKALKKHVPHTLKEEAARYENWQPGRSLSAN